MSQRSGISRVNDQDTVAAFAEGILDVSVLERVVGPPSIDYEAILVFARLELQIDRPEVAGATEAVHGSG